MLQELATRKKHYLDLSGENNFILEKLEILKHCDIPDSYFIHAKYIIGDGGIFKNYEVLETTDENGDWKNLKNSLDTMEYGAFLNDCTTCNF
jgi:hypothetical protein